MRQVQIGQAELLECEKCGGIWVDAETFEHLCADSEARAGVLHRWPETPQRRVDTVVRYRPCVSCGAMMNRINFGKLSGTVVDVCKGHGTFLDSGELHQVVAFIRDGGLDRARRRQLEDLKEEEAPPTRSATNGDPRIQHDGYVGVGSGGWLRRPRTAAALVRSLRGFGNLVIW